MEGWREGWREGVIDKSRDIATLLKKTMLVLTRLTWGAPLARMLRVVVRPTCSWTPGKVLV